MFSPPKTPEQQTHEKDFVRHERNARQVAAAAIAVEIEALKSLQATMAQVEQVSVRARPTIDMLLRFRDTARARTDELVVAYQERRDESRAFEEEHWGKPIA